MKKSRFTESQIVSILKEADAIVWHLQSKFENLPANHCAHYLHVRQSLLFDAFLKT